jgi:hypothetical protein
MAKEIIIQGKNCRHYYAGRIWVSKDGTLAAQAGRNDYDYKILAIQENDNGKFVTNIFGIKVSIAYAVMKCFGRPEPNDGKRHVIRHKDGDLRNCESSNLEWIVEPYHHNSAPSIDLTYKGITFTVHKSGEVFFNNQVLTVCDYIFDARQGLNVCVEPYITLASSNGDISLRLDSIMASAGYVNGDNTVLKYPEILHRDNDWKNFASDNLEWVEILDRRFSDYKLQKQADRHKRNVEINPGKTLPVDM